MKSSLEGSRGDRRYVRSDTVTRSVHHLAGRHHRYSSFFALFGEFSGYVEFFLLQDLVDEKGAVKFYLPFSGYAGPALPDSLVAYQLFRSRQLDFVAARNERMLLAVGDQNVDGRSLGPEESTSPDRR
ncbi:DUF6994 family protein [Microbacterium sp. CJ77]|uniref:DUF6994 family protein n=1 Tax=Microbacterium sp. CJ77 TaxID=2079201 RepID=UPI000CD805A7|nr:hypothetical protein [Microbacterium sp. CJ77]